MVVAPEFELRKRKVVHAAVIRHRETPFHASVPSSFHLRSSTGAVSEERRERDRASKVLGVANNWYQSIGAVLLAAIAIVSHNAGGSMVSFSLLMLMLENYMAWVIKTEVILNA